MRFDTEQIFIGHDDTDDAPTVRTTPAPDDGSMHDDPFAEPDLRDERG